jgi:UDP-GlcNAc:undecaprenyl-phosphate GlcNAc-1-phosphate transferase
MAIIPLMWRMAPHLGLLDQPNARKVHKAPIPTVGGWGIVIGALAAAAFQMHWTPLFEAYVLGALVLFLFGVIDDRLTLSHRVKFIGQFIAAGLVIFHGDLWIHHAPYIPEEYWPAWAGITLSFFAIVGMINAMNTSDGLDGLAGGECVLSLLVIAFLAYMVEGTDTMMYAVTVIGGVLGFLRFNTHPARVFMGDAGSQFLGFSLGMLAILITQQTFQTLSPATTLLFLGLPIIDIFAVMIQRMSRGESPFKAGRNHVHHRLLDLGFSHTETVVLIYVIHGTFVLSAIVLRHESDWLVTAVYLSAIVVLFGALQYAEKSGWRRTRPAARVAADGDTTQDMRPMARWPIRIVGVMVPLFLLVSTLGVPDVPRDFAVISAVLAVVLLLDMVLGRSILSFTMRGALYVAAVFVVYLAEPAGEGLVVSRIESAFFITLTVLLALTVKYSAGVRFETSPMDYLILGGVIIATVFGQGQFQNADVSMIMVKAVLVLYATEIIVERSRTRWSLLNVVALICFCLFAWRGLIGPH